MNMKLMIVESPNKVKKIESILGAGWRVAASVGHIRDLPLNEMGVEAPDFVPRYVFSDRGGDVVARLKKLASSCTEIYLATDPDREGEAIAWHLKEALKLKSYKRITFDAINEQVIAGALAKARPIDMNLVRAQEGRRILDRLVGYMVSPKISDATGIRGLSAGRVQSPATRLVAERERQIQLFKQTLHFGAKVSFGGWSAEWDTKPYRQDDSEYILDKDLAERAASCREFEVKESISKPGMKAPPSPFRSATLIQAASVQLAMSPDKTMDLAQKLFAAGHISYHRTDKQNFDESTIASIREFAQAQGWPLPAKPRKWPSVEGAQEGHEAIKPMHLEIKSAGDSFDEKNLYELIWKRAIASQIADAEYLVNTNTLTAEVDGETFEFVGKGRVLVKPGWKVITERDAAEESDTEESEFAGGEVPVLTQGATIEAEEGEVLNKKTQAPSRYTLASLVNKLEKMGIGRPSTYPAILKNITERGYIVEEKRKLKPTELGMKLVVALVRNKFSFVNFDFTSAMELELDKIAGGKASYVDVVTHMYEQLQIELGAMHIDAGPQFPCPECKAPLGRLPGKDKGTYFWGCSAFRETGCKGSLPDDRGVPGTRNNDAKGGKPAKR